jgi:hypothetical protein
MTDWTEAEFKALNGYDQSYGYSRYHMASTQVRPAIRVITGLLA